MGKEDRKREKASPRGEADSLLLVIINSAVIQLKDGCVANLIACVIPQVDSN